MKPIIFLLLNWLLLPYCMAQMVLIPNKPSPPLSAEKNSLISYVVELPQAAPQLTIAVSKGTGDADLYVRYADPANFKHYDCRPFLHGNSESCLFTPAKAGQYFITLHAYKAFSHLILQASAVLPSALATPLATNKAVAINTLQQGEQREFLLSVDKPSQLTVSITGDNGDADLYVRRRQPPTLTTYDCRPYSGSSHEHCDFETATAGNWYISVRAFKSFQNLTLSNTVKAKQHLATPWPGFSQYYRNAIGKEGPALADALQEAASRHQRPMSYRAVWTALAYTDQDPQKSDNVLLFYSGRSQSKNFTASGNNHPDAWNREHSWPKSRGFKRAYQWAHTDIHHLRPTDVTVNSARGSKDYAEGGGELEEALGNFTDSDSFEPRDAVKGDVARMMFYMAVRYNGDSQSQTPDLQLQQRIGFHKNRLGELCTLLKWHQQDPVDEIEQRRHLRIIEKQGNRNPFIDYPNWALQLWQVECE